MWLSRKVEATERDIEACCEEIAAFGPGERRVATDLVGGPAALLEAVLLERGERVLHLPGMGPVFTAEFLAEVGDPGRFASADALDAAAGVAPVLRASGATSHRRRARRGNRVLKRVPSGRVRVADGTWRLGRYAAGAQRHPREPSHRVLLAYREA